VTTSITIEPNQAAYIPITIYLDGTIVSEWGPDDTELSALNYGATIEWGIFGTSIMKTTDDNSIFSAHPMIAVVNNADSTSDPYFLIHIRKEEVATLSGSYLWTLSITSPEGLIHNTTSGEIIIGDATAFPPPDISQGIGATVPETTHSSAIPIGWQYQGA
jgi:hypothetical protein